MLLGRGRQKAEGKKEFDELKSVFETSRVEGEKRDCFGELRASNESSARFSTVRLGKKDEKKKQPVAARLTSSLPLAEKGLRPLVSESQVPTTSLSTFQSVRQRLRRWNPLEAAKRRRRPPLIPTCPVHQRDNTTTPNHSSFGCDPLPVDREGGGGAARGSGPGGHVPCNPKNYVTTQPSLDSHSTVGCWTQAGPSAAVLWCGYVPLVPFGSPS